MQIRALSYAAAQATRISVSTAAQPSQSLAQPMHSGVVQFILILNFKTLCGHILPQSLFYCKAQVAIFCTL